MVGLSRSDSVPTTQRPENKIIELFVSAYENDAWKNARLTFPDQIKDGEVDGFAERPDGATLAIEHTVVEPFVGDIADQSEMLSLFPLIEQDKSLLVPGAWIRLFVPVGAFHLQKPPVREAIVRAVRDWLRINRLLIPMGDSEHACRVKESPGKPDFDITLTLKVVAVPGGGEIHVRRQQVGDTFGDVIERMLAKKLSKLVKSAANKRILLLERRHMNLFPERIHQEIERRREMFPSLRDIHEIWIAEKIPFFQNTDGDVRFELWERGKMIRTFDFQGGKLFTRSEDGMTVASRS
jgi:hypothetical protein